MQGLSPGLHPGREVLCRMELWGAVPGGWPRAGLSAAGALLVVGAARSTPGTASASPPRPSLSPGGDGLWWPHLHFLHGGGACGPADCVTPDVCGGGPPLRSPSERTSRRGAAPGPTPAIVDLPSTRKAGAGLSMGLRPRPGKKPGLPPPGEEDQGGTAVLRRAGDIGERPPPEGSCARLPPGCLRGQGTANDSSRMSSKATSGCLPNANSSGFRFSGKSGMSASFRTRLAGTGSPSSGA